MRFDNIEYFDIADLSLDEANYRFKKAEDQQACINKIYSANAPYFKGLMKSIAEDDLGEPLLVYRDGKTNVVADGNRRVSALKVLSDDSYAPNETTRQLAEELRNKFHIDFSKIQAQTSSDKKLISKTVYERHSGGKNGASRIPWNAYASARFGFDETIGDSKEWYIMALLSKLEEDKPETTNFIDSGEFSYEVFRRIVRGAVSSGKISENIFSGRGERIKKTADKDLVKDAIVKVFIIIEAMRAKEITLSRKGDSFADKGKTEHFLDRFSLSPDNQKIKDAKTNGTSGVENSDSENSESETAEENSAKFSTSSATTSEDKKIGSAGESEGFANLDDAKESGEDTSKGTDNRIAQSQDISKKLEKLDSEKLSGLYYSLHTVSLNKHPALMYVGAWSFFEVLSKYIGNTDNEFPGYFRSKAKNYGFDKPTVKDFGAVLDQISNFGNATKHSRTATPVSAVQLRNDFLVLEPLIVAALDRAIADKRNSS